MSVNLIWIPSHAGIVGNEEADSLAFEAASSDGCAPDAGVEVDNTQIFIAGICRQIKESSLVKCKTFLKNQLQLRVPGTSTESK